MIKSVIPALAFFFLVFLPPAEPEERPPAKILLLHSYHADYPWVAAITDGVREVLTGDEFDLRIFYMDTKRNTSPRWFEEAGAAARKLIDEWQPEIVIAADDNAQKFVTRRYAGEKTPLFVFCGVNEDPATYGLPASNVTGLIERPLFTQSIDLALELIPRLRTVAVISDKSPTSIGALRYMRRQAIPVKTVGWNLIRDFDTWKKRVREYCLSADAVCIYMYHTLRDNESETSLPPSRVMEWTAENCTVPTIGFFDFAINDGVTLGVVESGKAYGRQAALISRQLLNGKTPDDFPVRTVETGKPMINPVSARKSGLIIPEETIDKIRTGK